MSQDITARLSRLLSELRREHGWTLDDLARRSGLSRATLSRLENASVSPTAETLAGLGKAYRMPVSRLLALAEGGFAPLVSFGDQAEWEDGDTGQGWRSVSPPSAGLAAEVHECHLPPDTRTELRNPSRSGREHHLVMLDGALGLSVDGTDYDLTAGDCLRFHLVADARLETGAARGARYLLFRI